MQAFIFPLLVLSPWFLAAACFFGERVWARRRRRFLLSRCRCCGGVAPPASCVPCRQAFEARWGSWLRSLRG